MADFTPYTAPSWNYGYEQWGTAKDKYVAFPEYERYSGDYDELQNQIYSGIAAPITQQKDIAYNTYMNRQRVLGVGDSPITDVVWGERIAPTYNTQYETAAGQAAQLRSNLEMQDINAYNTAMQTRTAYENQTMTDWINNYLNRDYQTYATNTAAGFQNAALSAASSLAGSKSDSSLWGAIMTALGTVGGQVAGNTDLTSLFGGSSAANSNAAGDLSSAGNVGGVSDALGGSDFSLF
jgi:hypothetical protein